MVVMLLHMLYVGRRVAMMVLQRGMLQWAWWLLWVLPAGRLIWVHDGTRPEILNLSARKEEKRATGVSLLFRRENKRVSVE